MTCPPWIGRSDDAVAHTLHAWGILSKGLASANNHSINDQPVSHNHLLKRLSKLDVMLLQGTQQGFAQTVSSKRSMQRYTQSALSKFFFKGSYSGGTCHVLHDVSSDCTHS